MCVGIDLEQVLCAVYYVLIGDFVVGVEPLEQLNRRRVLVMEPMHHEIQIRN